jgi:hypothetical protein
MYRGYTLRRVLRQALLRKNPESSDVFGGFRESDTEKKEADQNTISAAFPSGATGRKNYWKMGQICR